jgi:hypothetical protein
MLIFGARKFWEFQALKEILDLFCATIGMKINMVKSNMLVSEIGAEVIENLDIILPYARKNIKDGLKYLGFEPKQNSYTFEKWLWILKKNQARIALWVHRWWSREGKLVLIQFVLSNILVYWASIENIPKGILTKIRKVCFQFLWSGWKEAN